LGRAFSQELHFRCVAHFGGLFFIRQGAATALNTVLIIG